MGRAAPLWGLPPSTSTTGLESRCAAIGVTRVARVTGLDRTGIEVACAVRPEGYVLQVSNGKGRTWEEARRGAVSEAAELWACEHPDVATLRLGTPAELARHVGPEAVWTADVFGEATELPPGLRTLWCPARMLEGKGEVWIPASAVYCPRPGAAWLGPATARWTSNGMGAHPQRARAIDHALLELTERHLLASLLPEGFTPEVLARWQLAPEAVQALAPRVAKRLPQLAAQGFEVAFLLPTQGRHGLERVLPLAAVLLFDAEEGPHPLTAGYACRPSVEEALEAALFEAAQSRLTDIHGAREDIEAVDRGGAHWLREACRHVSARQRRARRPTVAKPSTSARGGVWPLLRGAGFAQAAVVDLASPDPTLHVVRAFVPGMRLSELL